MGRIEVWAVDDTRVERLVAHPRMWWLFLGLGVAWVLFGALALSYHVETLTSLAVFTGAAFIAGGVSLVLEASKVRAAHRWLAAGVGVAAIGIGVVPLVVPRPTLYLLAVLVGWYLMVVGTVHLVQALFHTWDRYWWADLVLGLVEIAIGASAAAYPGKSLDVLAVLIGVYALVHGVVGIFDAFALRGLDRDLRVLER